MCVRGPGLVARWGMVALVVGVVGCDIGCWDGEVVGGVVCECSFRSVMLGVWG